MNEDKPNVAEEAEEAVDKTKEAASGLLGHLGKMVEGLKDRVEGVVEQAKDKVEEVREQIDAQGGISQ